MLAGLKLVSNAKVPKTYILFNCNWGGVCDCCGAIKTLTVF